MSGNKPSLNYQAELELRIEELERENQKLKALLAQSVDNNFISSSLEEWAQNEKLLLTQTRILELIASGAALDVVLNEIIQFIEKESNGAIGSIVTLESDGISVKTCAAPHLPPGYNDAVNKVKTGPYSGSCGTAMFHQKMIIVPDIEKSEYWSQYGDIPSQYNLKACTSIPILGSGNQILGSFAFYYQKVYTPDSYEIKLIEKSSALAGIALEKNRTEKALREREELYRLISDNITALITIFDTEGTVVYANNMVCQTLGVSHEQIIGKKVFDLIHPDDQEECKKGLSMAIMGLPSHLIFRVQTHNGSWRWIEGSEKILNKGNKPYILALGMDVTERKETEDALKFSEEKFRTAFENANSGMALLSTDGTFIQVNDEWCKIIGYDQSELSKINSLELIHPEELSKSKQIHIDMLEGKCKSCNGEKRLKHARGHYIWTLVSTSILTDIDNIPLYFICMMVDITERKEAEETQKQLTEDLIRQNKDLEQFSYITSHNLRAPIANILGLVDLLTIYKEEDTDELLNCLKKAAGNLDSIIKDLNSIITLRKGFETNKEKVLFASITEGILGSLEQQIQQADATIDVDISASPCIHSVQSYVQSILANLIENAIKYRSPKRKLYIKIVSEISDTYTCVSVSDNGLGINLERYGHSIFGMYKRFHLHVEGKGLGLFLVKTQLEAIGGKIEVESEIDKGSTFKVYFKNN